MRSGFQVDLGFQPVSEGIVFREGGPRKSRRRHHACAKLSNNPLPDFRVIADCIEIRLFKREIVCLQLVVMAGYAVLVKQGAVACGGLRRCGHEAQKKCGASRKQSFKHGL